MTGSEATQASQHSSLDSSERPERPKCTAPSSGPPTAPPKPSAGGVTAAEPFGQAAHHANTYVPLPELHATDAGRVLPQKLRERREKASAALRAHAERFRRTATELLDNLKPRPKRVLFVGDSLVSGVGGSSVEAVRGPPLARRVSRLLADAYGVEVEWRSLGETGSDVSVIRRNLLPQIDQDYDVVVIMVGLNDFKQLARGEFLADAVGVWKDLEALVDEVKAKTNNAKVVLPAYTRCRLRVLRSR